MIGIGTFRAGRRGNYEVGDFRPRGVSDQNIGVAARDATRFLTAGKM